MIIDLRKFIDTERPYWRELADMIGSHEDDPFRRLGFDQIKRLHYLYQRASADLARISTFSAEQAIRDYLETLVGRAYAVIHASGRGNVRFAPLQWFFRSVPQTFRRFSAAFLLSVAVFMLGALFGAGALVIDPEAKTVLMPFEHLQMDPAERVAMEEDTSRPDRLEGSKGSFSAYLMTHNTRISILVLALGMSWGIGTLILLFGNGVMLGAVAADYVMGGQTIFLLGWLLPHGVIEIPAVLVAGQAGFILAGALINRAAAKPVAERLREVGGGVVHLIGAVAVMLVWAGIIEAFFSQYHEPVIAYGLKIAFGLVELGLLTAYLLFAGRRGGYGTSMLLRGKARNGKKAR
jgi:uncharacterized membrane protein SpoIIM required for sporulation